jgi:hypothetical protein
LNASSVVQSLRCFFGWGAAVGLFIAFQVCAAQYVHLTAEIETVSREPGAGAIRHTWEVRCVVGTNCWQMDGEFLKGAKSAWWFTGTNLIEHVVLTNDIPGAPEGTELIHTYDSADGNPGGPAHFMDLLHLPSARISWLAFCSGSCLKRDGRRLFPPASIWKERVAAPAGFSDRTVVFEDSLGLPQSVDLRLTNHTFVEYRVGRSTNISGWEFPLEFLMVQTRSATGADPEFTANGKVTAIGVGAKPEIPAKRQTLTTPVLKVDDAHYVSNRENLRPERYKINPCSNLVVDATGYTFKPYLLPQGKPVNTIEIIQHRNDKELEAGQRRYFLALTPGKTRCELSSATLQPRPGSPPFAGFQTGERWFLFIGSAFQTNSVSPAWSGIIEVQ